MRRCLSGSVLPTPGPPTGDCGILGCLRASVQPIEIKRHGIVGKRCERIALRVVQSDSHHSRLNRRSLGRHDSAKRLCINAAYNSCMLRLTGRARQALAYSDSNMIFEYCTVSPVRIKPITMRYAVLELFVKFVAHHGHVGQGLSKLALRFLRAVLQKLLRHPDLADREVAAEPHAARRALSGCRR